MNSPQEAYVPNPTQATVKLKEAEPTSAPPGPWPKKILTIVTGSKTKAPGSPQPRCRAFSHSAFQMATPPCALAFSTTAATPHPHAVEPNPSSPMKYGWLFCPTQLPITPQ